MRPRFARLRQFFSTPSENALLPNRRPLRIEPLEDRRMLTAYLVDSLGDTTGADGVITLREAIEAANTNAAVGDALPGSAIDTDSISFDGALFASGPATITLQNGRLQITDDLDIQGPGAESLTIDADGLSRVFYINGAEIDTAISGLTITGGNTVWDGGGVYNSGSLTITGATISGNSANNSTSGGGGIYNLGTLTVAASTISGNSAKLDGGGIYHDEGTATISNSTISGNSAGHGGGIRISFGTVTVTGSTILGNSAQSLGGGIENAANLEVTGSAILANSTDGAGGGIYNFGTLTVTSSTISGNSADEGCSGIRSTDTLTVTNSIVSLNVDPNGTDIEGLLTVDSGFNLIGVDPQFVRAPDPGADGTWGTEDDDPGDLHLTAESPAINFGNSSAVPPQLVTDLDGLPRIHGGRVDIGVYEYQADPPAGREIPSAVVTTLADTVDLYDGIVSLREALFYGSVEEIVGPITFHAALNADEIMLAGRPLSVGWSVQIDASSLDSLSVNADNKSRVFTTLADAIGLVGLTVTGGSARAGGGIRNFGTLTVSYSTVAGNSARSSGGILTSGSLIVTHSTISGNSAEFSGGGIDNSGTLLVTYSTISDNSARYFGGGLVNDGTLTVTNSTISGNSAQFGGGICGGPITVTYSTISGNLASGSGGGIYNWGTLEVVSSAIVGNMALVYGGGIYIESVGNRVTVTGSTISGNAVGLLDVAPGIGGGVFNNDGILTVHNTILASNTASGADPDVSGPMAAISSHNLIGDGSGMSGIANGINANLVGTAASPIDPRFVRAPSPGADGWWGSPDDDFGDLRLLVDSPAIDAGDDALAVNADGSPLMTDLGGNPRISGQRVDMGAYEYLRNLYWDEAGPGDWDAIDGLGYSRWLDADSGRLTFFPNNVGTAAVVREDTVIVPNDSQVSTLTIESGQVRVNAGQTLAIAGGLTVPDVSQAGMAGSEGLIAGDGDVELGPGSTLSLAAGDFLGDYSQREWGDCTRSIITVAGGITGTFDVEPLAGTYLGYGVFATDLGDNLQPVSYAVDAVLVDLFQAAPGDTDGNRLVEGPDILAILTASLFGDGEVLNPDGTYAAVWGTGDFDGNHKVEGPDILMMLQASLFGDGIYEGDLCALPAKSASIETSWIAQFEAVRHGKPSRHSRPARAVDELMKQWLVDSRQ